MFADAAAEMLKILDVLFEYCSLNRLSVNFQKTSVMIFKKWGRNFQNITFDFDNKAQNSKWIYTYSGISFKRSGLFAKQ